MQVRAQIEEHKRLQGELDQQQKKVDSLQNMVVVVDDNNTESGTGTGVGGGWGQGQAFNISCSLLQLKIRVLFSVENEHGSEKDSFESNVLKGKDNSCIVCIHKFCVTFTNARVLKMLSLTFELKVLHLKTCLRTN